MTADISFDSFSEAETVRFARALAAVASSGDAFALQGTLGMGKSVLARAFIQYFVGPVEVPSPTFTLVQSYEAPDFEIFHFDLYRLKKAEEIFEIGVEEALYNGVSLIEWPEMMGAYLPRQIIKICIEPNGEGRRITLTAPLAEQKRRFAEIKL